MFFIARQMRQPVVEEAARQQQMNKFSKLISKIISIFYISILAKRVAKSIYQLLEYLSFIAKSRVNSNIESLLFEHLPTIIMLQFFH